jgi:hypothetical protein
MPAVEIVAAAGTGGIADVVARKSACIVQDHGVHPQGHTREGGKIDKGRVAVWRATPTGLGDRATRGAVQPLAHGRRHGTAVRHGHEGSDARQQEAAEGRATLPWGAGTFAAVAIGAGRSRHEAAIGRAC